MSVTRRKRQRPAFANTDNNNGINKTTNATMQPTNKSKTYTPVIRLLTGCVLPRPRVRETSPPAPSQRMRGAAALAPALALPLADSLTAVSLISAGNVISGGGGSRMDQQPLDQDTSESFSMPCPTASCPAGRAQQAPLLQPWLAALAFDHVCSKRLNIVAWCCTLTVT